MDCKSISIACVILVVHFVVQSTAFNCELAPRPEITIPTDAKATADKIGANNVFKMSLELMYGGAPIISIGFVLADAFLAERPKSVWDQIKDKVEAYVHKELDANTLKGVCDDLKEFRRRIDICIADQESARTACLKQLLNYMIGKEPHFKGNSGRTKALLIGPYVIYSVMTLCVGNMFLKQNKLNPLEGAAGLEIIKPAARRFSQYVNTTVPEAVQWRVDEIGHYTKWGSYFTGWYEEGTGKVKRSLPSKRYGAPPVRKERVQLIVKDRLTDETIFKEDAYHTLSKEEAYKVAFSRARPIVDNLRSKARSDMLALYAGPRKITDQYWRVYEQDDFATVEAENNNRGWLDELESAAARDDLPHQDTTNDKVTKGVL